MNAIRTAKCSRTFTQELKKNLSNIFTPCSHLRMNFRCNTELSHCLNERGHVLCAGVAFAHTHTVHYPGGTVCEWDSQRLSLCMCVWLQQQWQAVIRESSRYWDTSTRTPTRHLTRLFGTSQDLWSSQKVDVKHLLLLPNSLDFILWLRADLWWRIKMVRKKKLLVFE